MKNWIKSAVFGAVAGVAGLSVAQEAAAVSFTVVVDKIELVQDASNYPNTATVVYDPKNGIGESATRTVNLFDATEKLGTSLNIRTPAAGEYESTLIFFSNIGVVSTTASISESLIDDLQDAGVLGSFAGQGVMVLGNTGTGATSVQTGYSLPGAAAFTPSIVATGGAVALPTLNFELAESDVTSGTGGGLELVNLPAPAAIVTQASDSVSNANLLVDVSATALAAAPGFTSGASVVTVGLFDDLLKSRPVAVRTFTAPSPVALTQVEFIDPPKSPSNTVNYYPVAWIDADSDGRLDTGEVMTAHSLTVASNAVQISGTADISYTALGSRGVLDEPAVQFGPRTVSATIALPNIETTPNPANNSFAANAAVQTTVTINAGSGNLISTTAASPATGTLVFAYVLSETGTNQSSRTLTFDAVWGADGSGVNNEIENSESAWGGLSVNGIAQAGSFTGVTYAGTGTNELTLTGIPLLSITTLSSNANVGQFELMFGGTIADSAGVANNQTLEPRTITEAGGGGASTTVIASGMLLDITSTASLTTASDD